MVVVMGVSSTIKRKMKGTRKGAVVSLVLRLGKRATKVLVGPSII